MILQGLKAAGLQKYMTRPLPLLQPSYAFETEILQILDLWPFYLTFTSYNNHLNAMVTLHISTAWPNLHACAQQGTRRVAAMDSHGQLWLCHADES